MTNQKPIYVIEASNSLAKELLIKYSNVLHENHCSPAIIRSVNDMLFKVDKWQKENPTLVKKPDIQDEKEYQNLLQENEEMKGEVENLRDFIGKKNNQIVELETENATLRGEITFLQNTIKGFKDLMQSVLSDDAKQNLSNVVKELDFGADGEANGNSSHPHIQ